MKPGAKKPNPPKWQKSRSGTRVQSLPPSISRFRFQVPESISSSSPYPMSTAKVPIVIFTLLILIYANQASPIEFFACFCNYSWANNKLLCAYLKGKNPFVFGGSTHYNYKHPSFSNSNKLKGFLSKYISSETKSAVQFKLDTFLFIKIFCSVLTNSWLF